MSRAAGAHHKPIAWWRTSAAGTRRSNLALSGAAERDRKHADLAAALFARDIEIHRGERLQVEYVIAVLIAPARAAIEIMQVDQVALALAGPDERRKFIRLTVAAPWAGVVRRIRRGHARFTQIDLRRMAQTRRPAAGHA